MVFVWKFCGAPLLNSHSALHFPSCCPLKRTPSTATWEIWDSDRIKKTPGAYLEWGSEFSYSQISFFWSNLDCISWLESLKDWLTLKLANDWWTCREFHVMSTRGDFIILLDRYHVEPMYYFIYWAWIFMFMLEKYWLREFSSRFCYLEDWEERGCCCIFVGGGQISEFCKGNHQWGGGWTWSVWFASKMAMALSWMDLVVKLIWLNEMG